jgi:hypothetical protein
LPRAATKSNRTFPHNRQELSGYFEFYDAVDSGTWIGTLDTGLTYQVTPDFSVDVDSFFGLTRSSDDFNCVIGFARRF